MPKPQVTPLGKLIMVIICLVALVGAYKFAEKSGVLGTIAPKGNKGQSIGSVFGGGKGAVNVCLTTWGGYAGGPWFNRGFKANPESRFKKEFGLDVNFVVIDDPATAREAWKSGKVDVMWTTADCMPTYVAALEELEPQVIFQADWSRGGDAIVAAPGIKSIEDLKGKKVAVAFASPSYSLLISALNASNITYQDIQIVEAPSAMDAAEYFKARQVSAAVVWAPDDEACVKAVPGAKVLFSTKQASHIIADVFYAKKSYIDKHGKQLTALIQGWLAGNAAINQSDTYRQEAAKILAAGMNQPEDFMYNAIGNARLVTLGDNKNFFGLSNSNLPKGEDLYNNMHESFMNLGAAPVKVPNWRTIINTEPLLAVELEGMEHAAEGMTTFAPMAGKGGQALATKRVTIVFASGSATLDANAQAIVDDQMATAAKTFGGYRIRVEGNTDNIGDYNMNQSLSQARAQSVVDYLVQTYGFDRNRFIVAGNGPNKPVADNNTSGGRAKNRRTDFELLN
jgi:NitT/TauT family transport system substrate-binding protein